MFIIGFRTRWLDETLNCDLSNKSYRALRYIVLYKVVLTFTFKVKIIKWTIKINVISVLRWRSSLCCTRWPQLSLGRSSHSHSKPNTHFTYPSFYSKKYNTTRNHVNATSLFRYFTPKGKYRDKY